MLIEKTGEINNEIKAVVLKNKDIELLEDQFFQWTETGKRLELWEGKKAYLDNINDGSLRRVSFWNEKSVVMFY